jgi:hypothetical protein
LLSRVPSFPLSYGFTQQSVYQLLTTYLDVVVYPAVEGTSILQRVQVDKFEADRHVLIEAYTHQALTVITDILRRSCKKLLTMDPVIYVQSRSTIVKTVTVTDIFRVVHNHLAMSEECEVQRLNRTMLFSCIKAIQRCGGVMCVCGVACQVCVRCSCQV